MLQAVAGLVEHALWRFALEEGFDEAKEQVDLADDSGMGGGRQDGQARRGKRLRVS